MPCQGGRHAGTVLGILHDFRLPGPGDHGAYLAECLDEVAEADRLGLRTVWLSEHHLTPTA